MSCPFFDNLPENPSHEQIHQALVATICDTMERTLRFFKTHMKQIATRQNEFPSDGAITTAIQKAYTSHTADTMYSLEIMFYGCPDILNRLDRAVKKPRLAGINKKLIKSGFYHIGTCYALYWYAITKTKASPSIVAELNCIHAEAMQKIVEVLSEMYDD